MSRRRWLADNVFLVAGVSLPLVVMALFLLATTVPRWFVEPPAYDLLLTLEQNQRGKVSLVYRVHEGRVEARAEVTDEAEYRPSSHLLRFDHATLTIRELKLEAPEGATGWFPVEALAGARLLPDPVAPDGYRLREAERGSPGLFGELFGMRRRGGRVSITKQGRVISADVAPLGPYFSHNTVEVLAWVADEPGDPAARQEALREIVALARAHDLGVDEIESALGANEPGSDPRTAVVRVLGYLGGIFIFAGLGVFIAILWPSLNALARIIATLGSGMSLYVLALLSHADPRYEKSATPLFLTAAALIPTGMMVTFNELSYAGDWRYPSLFTAATLALQLGLTFSRIGLTSLLLLTLLFGFSAAGIAMDLLDMDGDLIALTLGASMLLISAGVDRTPHGVITPIWYAVGGMTALWGLWDLVEDGWLEVVFVAAACATLYLSLQLRTRTLLGVSALAILAYTGYFSGKYFADSIGWPLALIVFGVAMLGLSGFVVRLDRQYMRPDR